VIGSTSLRTARERVAEALSSQRQILLNSGSMVGTAIVTALLGAAFWVVAAHQFSQRAVGIASAAVSAMTLLGFLATVGLGTLLMGELPRRGDDRRGLINAALIVVAGLGLAFGIGFAVAGPSFSSNLAPLRESPAAVLAFAAGTALTAGALVLDQSLIGLLRGSLQLTRNIVFSLVKLVGLFAVAVVASEGSSVWIYTVWAIGIALSFAVLVRFYAPDPADPLRPAIGELHSMRASAATHHAFNLALRIPDLVLPILVVTILSATANASFYVAWMIASLVFAIPLSLSTVLYAVGSGESSGLDQRFRFSLRTSLAFGVVANLVLWVLAQPLLQAFGTNYAREGVAALHILALGVFPEIIRTHYVTAHRIERRIGAAIPIVWGGTVLELVGGAVGGALSGGLEGVAVGWLAAVCLEAVVMGPDVMRAVAPVAPAAPGNQVSSRGATR
jgi:O-antigen/teichoic acid export membrane protein